MKLLIITQKVDRTDPILGFAHRWFREFAGRCEKLTIICLEEGEHDLPSNVSVHSLGKERRRSRFGYVISFYRYLFRFRNRYDAVFVHMNPEYVVLGGLIWRLLGKRVGLWYMHKSVDLKLRVAEKLVDRIFTGSAESFRLPSRKVIVTGHGIDTELFSPGGKSDPVAPDACIELATAGRIAPIKRVEVMVEAVALLKKRGRKVRLRVAGNVLPKDVAYFDGIKKQVAARGLDAEVVFVGSVRNSELPEFLRGADLFLNLAGTGSLDKAVLEAMASGIRVLTSNDAFAAILPDTCIVPNDFEAIASKIEAACALPVPPELREIVVRDHNLSRLIEKIVAIYGEPSR
jgi:glycosyltransferase involved in cell wall biosynthesis